MSTTNIPTGRALRFMFSYMRKHIPSVITGIFLLMIVDTLQLIIPRIVRRIIDTLGEQQFSSSFVIKYSLAIAGLALVMTLLRFCYRILLFLPSRKIEMHLRNDLFGHLMHLPLSFFSKTKTGDLMALFINDLNAVRMATGMALIGLTDALFMGTLSLMFMLTIDVRLTLLVIAPLPVIIFIVIRYGSTIQSRFKVIQEAFGTISSRVQEAFSGIRTVKGFAREQTELQAFSGCCDDYVDRNLKLVHTVGLFFPSFTLLGSISINLLFLFGGRQVIGGNLSFGSFVSFTFYIQLFLWPIMAFGWVYNMMQRGIASAKRLLELKETVPEQRTVIFSDGHEQATETVPPAGTGGVPPVIQGHIEIRNLTFRFAEGDHDVLRSITLNVPAGSSLGIVGKPGAGKTTLVSLLFHLHPVERGVIFFDDVDINDVPLPLLRTSIGYVPQDSFLFSDTIDGNIAFGVDIQSRNEAAIRRAARIAAIDKDITLFPAGYATVIGERGITLSGGQKQRLSIARAIIQRPSILVLDDALSSVDAGTEHTILSGLKSELQGRTSLVIAHRISTVRWCDSIVVLDNGVVTERGTHEELLAGGGFYSRLHALQSLQMGNEAR